jgi:hypothetical protein|tara:strand:- start:39 stop:3287 length:3249 start_codon:yes stop_codon:yes gene_type:complete
MPLYEVEITPGVFQDVEANNPSDARKIIKAQIAKGVVSPIYDELYFDYDTGVDDLQIRRLLGRAETIDEKESILRNQVGSSGFIKTTDGQIALTPKGLRERGLPVQTKTLTDGTTIELNTIIDSTNPFERGDLADFIGIAGPVLGSVGALLPQGRVFKAIKSLTGGRQKAAQVLAAAGGSAGGKGVEEVADALQGFQLQDKQELAGLLGKEAGLGVAGEGLSLLGGALWRTTFGAKEPLSNLRLNFQANKGRDVLDIQKLDISLGKEASEKQILDAIKAGKVKVLDNKFISSFQTIGALIPGRSQQIAEAVLGISRDKSNIPYLTQLFDEMTAAFRERGSSLNSYIDDATKDVVTDTINVAKKTLETDTAKAVKITQELVEDLTNSYLGIAPYKNALPVREYGESVLETLGEAKGAVNRVVGKEYDKVDELFFDLNNNEAVQGAVDRVISQYQQRGIRAISFFLNRIGKDTAKLGQPNTDVNLQNILNAQEGFRNLVKETGPILPGEKPYGKLTRVLELKRELNQYLAFARESKETDLFFKLTRLLDDYDLHAAKNPNFLKENPENADSIFTVLGLKGNQIIKNEAARQEKGLPVLFKDSISTENIGKINRATKALREADELNYKLNQPFDNATINLITRAARGKGSYDADVIFKELIYKGSTRQLEDFYKALKDYDDYLIKSDKPTLANNFERAKSQTLQRLFKSAFDNATDPVTDTIDYTAFAKYIQRFEADHPGKLDVLFRDKNGISNGKLVRDTINQLVKISPKLKPGQLKDLSDIFIGKDIGLSTTPKGEAFIRALNEQARASAKEADFLANRNLSDLPNKTPDEIVDTIFRPKNSENIIRLKQIMGDEEFVKIQDASLGKLLEDAIDFDYTGKTPITDIFKVGNLNTAISKYSPETLEAMFGKEFVTDLKNFANTVDILTKGEVGRGNFPGSLVAAGIAAGIAFAPLASLSTIAGLFVVKTLLGSPFIKLFTKTDKGSIRQLIEATTDALEQVGVRGIAEGIEQVGTTTEKIIEENVPTIDTRELLGQQSTTQFNAPQVNISLPQISPLPPEIQRQIQQNEDRIEFAERLFRRPVI